MRAGAGATEQRITQAVILAGGMGTRLVPLTEQIPKVMVSIGGRPFLLYILELLKSQGIADIILCIGYLGGQVREFFGNGGSLGMNIRYSVEQGKLLGTGGALKNAGKLLSDRFLVINGDTFLPIDYREVGQAFLDRGKKAIMVVTETAKNASIKGNAAIDDNRLVVRHDKESADPALKYTDAGVLVLRAETLSLIKPGTSISLEKGLYPALIRQRELAAFVTGQRFYDIGTHEGRGVFETFLKAKGGAGREWAIEDSHPGT